MIHARLTPVGEVFDPDGELLVDARPTVFDPHLTTLIKANVLLDGVDPLWDLAGAYGGTTEVVALAKHRKATRVTIVTAYPLLVEATVQALAPDLELTLEAGDGPAQLRDPWEEPDDDLFPDVPAPWEANELPEELDLELEEGVPVRAFGADSDGVSLVEQLGRLGARHGIGRGLALRDGLRTALEAPAAWIVIPAHRALEALVLSDRRRLLKDQLALTYADLYRQGRYHDPVMRDLEAFFDSTQREVSGTVRIKVYRGRADVIAVKAGDP